MNKVWAGQIDDVIVSINDLVDELKVIQSDERDEFYSLPFHERQAAYLKSSKSSDHLAYALYRLNMVIESLDAAKEA